MKLNRLFVLGMLSVGLMLTSCEEETTDTADNVGTSDNTDNGGTTEVPTPITLESTDAPTAGDIFTVSMDSTLSATYDISTGENKTWNFADLMEDESDTYTFTPFTGTDVAGATMTLVATSDPTTVTFIGTTNTSSDVVGISVMGLTVPLSDAMNVMTYPATYGDTGNDTFEAMESFHKDDVPSALLSSDPSIAAYISVLDSVKITRTGTVTTDINGWGELTYGSTTKDVLRIEKTEDATQVIAVYINGLGWLNVLTDTISRHYVQFQAKDSGLPQVEFELDADDNITEVSFQ